MYVCMYVCIVCYLLCFMCYVLFVMCYLLFVMCYVLCIIVGVGVLPVCRSSSTPHFIYTNQPI
jgi:hypothetical protein